MSIHEPVAQSESKTLPPSTTGWLQRVCNWWDQLWRRAPVPSTTPVSTPRKIALQPLQYVEITEGVKETLFEEYQHHRESDRGDEEIGWVLLGCREADHVTIHATLPAGTQRNASRTHVQFNSLGQVVGSYFVRQHDRRLTTLGVAHTHPGKLDKPSKGDYRGDVQWVEQIRGNEGVFAIGNVRKEKRTFFDLSASSRVQWGVDLCFTWYSLRAKARDYRSMEARIVEGVDLARPLHPLWEVIEEQATALERLLHQQNHVRAEVVEMEAPTLLVTISLLGQQAIRIALTNDDVRYYVEQEGNLQEVGGLSDRVDHAAYSLMAELAAQD